VSRRRSALVIGAAGQDGSYMCELLVEKGYDVVGLVRRDPAGDIPNLAAVRERLTLVQADFADVERVAAAVAEHRPGEVYNFASVSFGPDAWSHPLETARLGAVAFAGLIQAVRERVPAARLFQSSSAWVFGAPSAAPQNESTPYAPVEPYGAVKAYADYLIRSYRGRDELFACSGIFFNHESPRRSERFATRKVTRAAAAISLGREAELVLGDLDAERDWGFSPDFVRAAWSMLQQDTPRDYVIATGELHSVRELVEIAFGAVGLEWQAHVRVDAALQRGAGAVANLVGDASAARRDLGWEPTVTFDELVGLMVAADVEALSREQA
jgi:GDPmannose 4,6-dehydratase